MLETKVVRKLLDEAVFVGQGLEHRVVAPIGTNCVIKDYDPRLIDLETFEIFYKPCRTPLRLSDGPSIGESLLW